MASPVITNATTVKKFFLHPLRTGEKLFRDSKQILEFFDSNDITDQTLEPD